MQYLHILILIRRFLKRKRSLTRLIHIRASAVTLPCQLSRNNIELQWQAVCTTSGSVPNTFTDTDILTHMYIPHSSDRDYISFTDTNVDTYTCTCTSYIHTHINVHFMYNHGHTQNHMHKDRNTHTHTHFVPLGMGLVWPSLGNRPAVWGGQRTRWGSPWEGLSWGSWHRAPHASPSGRDSGCSSLQTFAAPSTERPTAQTAHTHTHTHC